MSLPAPPTVPARREAAGPASAPAPREGADAAAAAATTRPIRFFHRGAVVEVEGLAPTTTVLDWLREDARCSGTKEGC
ncbi:MAG TPA: hypothetical protein PLT38_06230, partial [Rubrivivax sp.]|nr:hypothetical protein [Rubrivivax sp.]